MLGEEAGQNSLIGLDLGTSLPLADCGAFFPGWAESPADAKALWALVDCVSARDPHLGASSFVDHPVASRYFRRHGGREGDRFGGGRGRFRVTEKYQARGGCKPYSNFNLVGAAQVGKSSLTGMRMLYRLQDNFAVWPFDPLPSDGPVIVEIYTAIAAIAAGRRASRSKMRYYEELNAGLAIFGSPPVIGVGPLDDNSADALLTATWLRNAAEDAALWSPWGLTPELAATEGWTFGVS